MRRLPLAATLTLLAATALPTVALAPAEAKPAPKPKLTAKAVRVAENAGKAVVPVTLSKRARKAVKVAWSTQAGTAMAGSDFTASSGTLTIKKGKKAGTITVPVLDDAVHEATETFTIGLATKQARGVRAVTVTIGDNDAPAPPTPSLPTAPSALVGTITVAEDVTYLGTTGLRTLTMNLHLVPTSVPGEWRDNGSGTWSAFGNLAGAGNSCGAALTTVSGTGSFLTAAGPAGVGQAALALTGFAPATATGTPALTWDGASNASMQSWTSIPMPPPALPMCIPMPFSGTLPFTMASPGATGSYTGSTGAGRGLSFAYTAGTTSVSGTLTPVP
jgi:Calx-beta domain-containing protein